MRRAFLAGLLTFFAAIACAQATPAAQTALPKTSRILFIGNSLTFATDIPGRLAKLARAMGKDAVIESVALPSYSLEDHWNDGRALAAIRKGWDVVVLQQGTSAHAEGREQLVQYSKKFAPPIREAGARPALYMVWPLSDRPRDFPAAIESYRLAAQAVDGLLIPVGEAWFRALTKDRKVRLYGDSIHPSSLGSDLTVLTIYLSLFPAGRYEFNEAYVAKIAGVLEMQESRRDLFFDAATLAIDEPLALK
ncbi:MAG: hypothetical protein ACXWG8_05165 [Usitatibacter sp.]